MDGGDGTEGTRMKAMGRRVRGWRRLGEGGRMWSFRLVRWHIAMAYYDGMLRWQATMAYCDDILRWHATMAYCDGILRWQAAMAYCDGMLPVRPVAASRERRGEHAASSSA